MVFRPVGINEDSEFPPRVESRLFSTFSQKGEVTITVAAIDSSDSAKARADYVCTGSGYSTNNERSL
jgi:hypothetical protein